MLKIFNTKKKKKEFFKSIKKKIINMYVCGATVYDYCHIGHGRTFVIFDVFFRYFCFLGYTINYVRNITDIDDKIIDISYKKKINIKTLTKKIIKQMDKDFKKLNIISPSNEPIVTDYIVVIINFIKKLIKKKFAYVSNNFDVLFSIKKCKNYGKLSNRKKFVNSLLFKNVNKNSLDFVLWKKSNFFEPGWLSPWGFGRPGWHIECSALHSFFFKDYIDIHGGGIDLIFPHHENELSQSISYNKNYVIKYWLHSGMLILKDQKMSKSLGNSIFLKDIFKKYHGETLRFFFLSKHYRKPLFFNKKDFKKSFILLKKFYKIFYFFKIKKNQNIKSLCLSSFFLEKFFLYMNDDFNIPKILNLFIIMAKKINFLRFNYYKEQSYILVLTLLKLGRLIGLFCAEPYDYLNYNKKKIDIGYIKFLIYKRNCARKKKKWKKSDLLRKQLDKMGLIIEDGFF